MGEETKITRVVGRHMDAQAKFMELMQGQASLNAKVDRLIERIDRLLVTIDNYPATSLERIDEIKEKLSGDEGLRVLVKEQHAHLKSIIRNWQLLAAAAITAMGIITNTLIK